MFKDLERKIEQLKYWDKLDVFEIGKSSLGQPIYCIHVGNYHDKQILIDGGIHAREYISSFLVVELAKNLAHKSFIGGFYLIPVCNPDGVRIAMDGVDWIEDEKLRLFLISINNNSTDFSLWKANGLGVDLNVNFDADWGGGKQNLFKYSPANFIGHYPNSEKETNVLIDFVKKYNPKACVSFHCKGEVIYYGFQGLSQSQLVRDFSLCEKISNMNNYEIIKTENSTGGFTDWVSRKFGIPAITIELGSDKLQHPISLEYLDLILSQNQEVPIICSEFINK